MRETGYYWVKLEHKLIWEIALWVASPAFPGRGVFILGGREWLQEHVKEINETRILNPDEK